MNPVKCLDNCTACDVLEMLPPEIQGVTQLTYNVLVKIKESRFK